MKIIKDKKIVTPLYIAKLHDWLLENQETYFIQDNEANSFADFDFSPTKTTDRKHLCMPNEVMLIDRSNDGEHTYCICTVSKNNKVTSQKPVIEVNKLKYGVWKNGYFLLPKLED